MIGRLHRTERDNEKPYEKAIWDILTRNKPRNRSQRFSFPFFITECVAHEGDPHNSTTTFPFAYQSRTKDMGYWSFSSFAFLSSSSLLWIACVRPNVDICLCLSSPHHHSQQAGHVWWAPPQVPRLPPVEPVLLPPPRLPLRGLRLPTRERGSLALIASTLK